MTARAWQRWTIAFGFLAIAAAAPADEIHIQGSTTKPSDWTVEQIQTQLAADIKPVEYKSKGAMHTFSCVPLVSLLKAAGVPVEFVMKPGADPKVKNPQMRRAVLVSGRDGYSVAFSMAELLPMVGNRAVWVALEEDGKPLSENDGPVRLIVPDDGMPARGVHGVASIDVVEVNAAATQPANP
jgi:hypothetical protein